MSESLPCGERGVCDESGHRCYPPGCDQAAVADQDGDGYRSIECGGTDCNDLDANTNPNLREVCDAEGHDEDCDGATYGDQDLDGDSEYDIRCLNRGRDGSIRRGTDYDDNSYAVRRGSMICDGPDAVVVVGPPSGAAPAFLNWQPEVLPCPSGTKCVVQPNRTGICMVPPDGYVTPSRFVPPSIEPLPSLRTLLSQGKLLMRPGPNVPNLSGQPSVPREQPAATKPSRPATLSAGGSTEEVAACKRTLQSGKVSWGGGTKWTSANIDKLCKGTKDAKATIACFQTNVGALGWSAAIDRCK